MKLLLSPVTVDALRQHALATGKTEEFFDQWVKENVEVYKIMTESEIDNIILGEN